MIMWARLTYLFLHCIFQNKKSVKNVYIVLPDIIDRYFNLLK